MFELMADQIAWVWLKLDPATHFGASAHFFIADAIKIFLLLTVVIFSVSVIRGFFPPERTRKLLSQRRLYLGNFLAALLGVVTPF